ncbi:hypothetical protein ACFV23_52510 [Streptomyces sp. NPDC059627]
MASEPAGTRGGRMLDDELAALATAGAAAVVQAAGSDAWEGFRRRLARWLGNGDQDREDAEWQRLGESAHVLSGSVPPAGAPEHRARQVDGRRSRVEAQ